MSTRKAWGYHLLLDLAGCNANVSDAGAIKAYVTELLEAIDMVAYGEPVLKHFAEHLPHAAGYSLVQLIETSAVTGHFSDNNRDAYLDVFSCKPFDADKAIAVTEKHFGPATIHALKLSRDARRPPERPFTKVR